MQKVFSFFLIVLLLTAVFAQNVAVGESFRVLENESRVEIYEKQAKVSLKVENTSGEFAAKIKAEIVAPDDSVRATAEVSQNVGRGRQNLTILFDLAPASLKENELLWYRLRYEIAVENSQTAKTFGIVSFSQILPEVFELKVVSGDAFAEKMFRARIESVNPANQKAVENVEIYGEIEIENRAEKLKATAKTDADGAAMLEFRLPDFEMSADVELKVTGRKNGLTREVSDDLPQLAGKFAEVVTDKPLYQPKQTVNLRLYSYNFNRLPLKNRELTFEIEAEESEETVFREKAKTSRFGIAFASWKIPENAGLGNYQITVKDAEDDEIAYERIKITRYELPNFAVEAKPERAFYLPTQTSAKVEINAKYLFGKPLTDGKVRIVSRENDDEFFAEANGTLDDEGEFSAEIDLSKAFETFKPNEYRRFKDLKFSAYVTDPTTNRTEPRSFDIRITNEPIHVYLIGDTDEQSTRLPLEFYVSTFYADGTPAVCEVGIYELIGKDADGNEIKPEIGKSLAKLKTNKYGAGKLSLPLQLPEDEDEINVKLVATDAKGATGNVETEIDTEDEDAIRITTDKIAYRKGEPVKISIVSSRRQGKIFVDAIGDHEVVEAKQLTLANNRAELVLPYRAEYKNTVTIAAYFEDEDDDDDFVVETKNIVFPTPTNLDIKAATKKEIYRPGETVAVKFRSRNAEKKFAETALGVLVIDKAVEERARIESETGDENAFLNRTFPSRLTSLFGTAKVFGEMTVRDVKNLDLAKPLAPDLELAVEIALGNNSYRPQMARTDDLRDDLDKLFTPLFRAKMQPVADALTKTYREKEIFPTDEQSLREILRMKNIDFDALRDAWGNPFRTEFRIEKDVKKLTVWSLGADKTPETSDDLIVLEDDWRYFRQIGKAIDQAAKIYTERTNGFITDFKTLRDEMRAQHVNLDELRDAWGNPYRFEFTVDRTNYVLNVKSDGANGRQDGLIPSGADDFTLWTNRADYFTVTRANLLKNFNEYVQKAKNFPKNEAEMSEILKASGFNLAEVKDVYSRPFYVEQRETANTPNYRRYRNERLKSVKQKITSFAVKSAGNDGIKGNYDDFELASFSGATDTEEFEADQRSFSEKRKIIREKTAVTPNGAIAGIVFDAVGAVIPGAEIAVKNANGSLNRTVTSDDDGEFLISNLPKDIYSIEVSAPNFQKSVITNFSIEAGIVIEIDVMLEVGTVQSVVEVSSGVEMSLNTASAMMSQTVISPSPQINSGIQPSFTPRVRDYFAETLVWSPELITNKRGEAELKFKMADSLTTWKLYAIGSDEQGNFGLAEKELQTFQPFFAELDPPKILTTGDRISLPVPVRNYTDKRQKVSVAMARNDWSRNLNGAAQNIEIAPNSTKNAVFDFEAVAAVTEGKQKVTALAKKEGDAIEKSVTVRPNGKEIVETQSDLFERETVFDVNFPADSFADSRTAELKIYPNMLAHVAESVEGLLKRPYGCGEQTTSSTYPNLLILKIEKELKKEIDPQLKAKASEYLTEGYKRLLNYQTDSGFGYWNGNSPDVALTAYVLRFLHDARDFIEIDERSVEKAENWLLRQQKTDGSWENAGRNTDVATVYVMRSLSLTTGTDARKTGAVKAAGEYLKKRLNEIGDSYVLANLALVALEIGDAETWQKAIEKLQNAAVSENNSAYWQTSGTPFYGWGTAGRVETTALVVQFLIKSKVQSQKSKVEEIDNLISRGTMFLLKNKDRYGVWHSTQTTINVLDALILLQNKRSENASNPTEKGGIFVNGVKIREFSAESNNLKNPFVFDLSEFLSQNENRVEIKGLDNLNLTMAQIVSQHYLKWETVKDDNKFYDFKVDFDKTKAAIGEEINCTVKFKQKTYRYGMMLAEIGLPPGADVDRRSLDQAKTQGKISSYDILPDRIVAYFWANSKELDFGFKFKPRYGIIAQNAPSTVYDYYNEEAKATLVPLKFEVK